MINNKLLELLRSTDNKLVQFINISINMIHSSADPLVIHLEYNMTGSVFDAFNKYIDLLIRDEQLIDTRSGKPLESGDIGILVTSDDSEDEYEFEVGFGHIDILGTNLLNRSSFRIPYSRTKHVYVDLTFDNNNIHNSYVAVGLVVDSVGMASDPNYTEHKYSKLNDDEHQELSSRRRR